MSLSYELSETERWETYPALTGHLKDLKRAQKNKRKAGDAEGVACYALSIDATQRVLDRLWSGDGAEVTR